MTIISEDGMGTMKALRDQETQITPESDSSWSSAENPTVAELLDHIAEMLAVEYVRLMEQAAQDSESDS